MSVKLLDQILKETYVKHQALLRLHALKEVTLHRIFSRKALPKDPSYLTDRTAAWLDSLDQTIYKQFDRNNAYKIFEETEKELKAIPSLIIYLPFELPDDEVNHLGKYLRQDYGKNFLIDILIDPELVAGAAFVWKGDYKDYSLRQKIDENKSQILYHLHNYLNQSTSTNIQSPNPSLTTQNQS